jgi:hypothetical protein
MRPSRNGDRARFWVFGNGWTKLTLSPGQSLSTSEHYGTDEGWTASSQTWTHRGNHVELEWTSDGVDCDGRLSASGNAICMLGNLRTRLSMDEKHYLPDWIHEDHQRRDYRAEAAGY